MEQGYLPDSVIRWGIRRLCKQRLTQLRQDTSEKEQEQLNRFIEDMNSQPVAPVPEKANEQHYELPPEFFALVLGKHRKYSSCYWDDGTRDLNTAESKALELSCQHAKLQNGQHILELGCGWGSLTLYMAKQFPNSNITAVSNSAPQRNYILSQARKLNLQNIDVVTADMNHFSANQQFDRIVSIEMFEHMRNYHQLMSRAATWLKTDGILFIHIFNHQKYAYPFETAGDENWMGKYFFTGGIMPSAELLLYFQNDLTCKKSWLWDGTHYQKTANAWLNNIDQNKTHIMPILINAYGQSEATRWYNRWRVFFLACAETFGYAQGREWSVRHYQFAK